MAYLLYLHYAFRFSNFLRAIIISFKILLNHFIGAQGILHFILQLTLIQAKICFLILLIEILIEWQLKFCNRSTFKRFFINGTYATQNTTTAFELESSGRNEQRND